MLSELVAVDNALKERHVTNQEDPQPSYTLAAHHVSVCGHHMTV